MKNRFCCPNCQGQDLIKYGKTSGNQRWLCKNCDCSFTGNEPGRPKKDSQKIVLIPNVVWQTLEANAKTRKLTASQYLEDILIREFEE